MHVLYAHLQHHYVRRNQYNSGLNYWHWQYKALGSYELPWGLNSSATLRITKGEPYGRIVNSSGLSQGTLSLTVEPIGTFFYPTVKLLDLRLSKSIRLGENWVRSKAFIDVFNVNNSAALDNFQYRL